MDENEDSTPPQEPIAMPEPGGMDLRDEIIVRLEDAWARAFEELFAEADAA